MPGYPRPSTVPPSRLRDLAVLLGVVPAGGGPAAVLGGVVPAGGGPAAVLGVGGAASGVGGATGARDAGGTTGAGGTGAGDVDVVVRGVTHASGDVRPGDLYAALPGSRRHGAEFVADAARAGASAVLTDPAGAAAAAAAGLPALVVADPRAVLGTVADRIYGEPTRHLAVLGVTGTAGKTSTVHLIEAGLRAAGRSAGLIGTVGTRLGDLVLDSARTTPEATDLHALFAVARERGVDSIAIEVSSHALALGRVGGVRFAVGGFTNLGTDHLDFHADAADYFAAKARLFDGRCDTEIVNVDDPAGRRLRRAGTVTYTALGRGGADWYATDFTETHYAQRFLVHGPGGLTVEAGVRLPGRHNVANVLLAIAALVAVGVDPAVAARGVAECPGAPGRMERVDAAGPVLGVVDYAHKPDAIAEVLAALSQLASAVREPADWPASPASAAVKRPGLDLPGSDLPGSDRPGLDRLGRVICVIGAGGDRDRGKRALMGAAAARGADLVIVTDDNPRAEDTAVIRAEVRRGALDAGGAEVVEVAGRRAAIAEAVRRADAGDVVALLGKGHETGQEIAGEVYPFDDRVELAVALGAAFGVALSAAPTADQTSRPGAGSARDSRPGAGRSDPSRPGAGTAGQTSRPGVGGARPDPPRYGGAA